MSINKNIISVVLLPIIIACGLVAEPLSLDAMLDAGHRTQADRERDQYRNPVETLNYFGLEPGHHVLEIWPGSGWYTDIVAPYVKSKGQYTAATFSPERFNSDDKREVYWSKVSVKFMDKVSNSSIYGDVKFAVFEDKIFDTDSKPKAVDLALLVRSIHIWDERGMLSDGLKSVFEVLKPGGVLGIVQHRSNSVSSIASSAAEGYMDERYVIEAVKQAGFVFEGSIDANQNLSDTKDYPKGVYALPPTLAMGNVDREKYLAIGESDRMTLKFVKPLDDKH